jgi:mannosyltransferase OCH1-like enzyme
MIPKRFIRHWIGGSKKIPAKFDQWWDEFKEMHPGWEFVTLRDYSLITPTKEILPLLANVSTCAGSSDIGRILALYQLGGVYVDTDVMPLKPFDGLLEDPRPFLAMRSSKSFETAIMGSPKGHPAFADLIEALPKWYYEHEGRSASVQTGPAFVSSVLFGRVDIRHLPPSTFYPYNGFMAPKREEKIKMFSDKSNFPPEMLCAHFSNHRWGGKP